MIIKLLLSITAVFLILNFPSIASANLLINGDFETGDLTGWGVFEGNDTTIAAQNPRSGSRHGRNTWDGAWDGVNNTWRTGIYQDVSVISGQQYRLTGHVFIPSGGVPQDPLFPAWDAMIELEMYNVFDGGSFLVFAANRHFLRELPRDQYNLIDFGWQTAPSSANMARVKFSSSAVFPDEPASPIDFDDFDFSPIPEPASLMLLGSGLIGLAGLTKKRRV